MAVIITLEPTAGSRQLHHDHRDYRTPIIAAISRLSIMASVITAELRIVHTATGDGSHIRPPDR